MSQTMLQEKKNPILNNRYEILKELGSGHTSTVHLALDKRSDSYVALKIIKDDYITAELRNRDRVNDEMHVMKLLEHNGIVKIYDRSMQGVMLEPCGNMYGNVAFLVMEYVPGTILIDFVSEMSESAGLGEAVGRLFMTQLLDSIEYMHNQGIVHRDIKAENIIISNNFEAKLIDFGFASYENNDKLTNYCGTPAYMAPEIKKGLEQNGQ